MKPPRDDMPTTSAGEGHDAASQPSTEPSAEPSTESPTEPSTEPPIEPSAESPTEPSAESPAEPLNEIEAFRAQELLLLRATEGLSELQLAELTALGADDDDSYDLAAAAVDLATLPRYELPSDVAQRLLLAAGVRPPRAATEGAPRHQARHATQARRDPSPAPSSAQSQSGAPAPPLQLPVLPAERPAPAFSPNGPRAVSSSGTTSPIVPRPSRAPIIAAWSVAAVAIAAAALFAVWQMRQPAKTIVQRVEVPVPAPQPEPPTPAQGRAELLATATDVQTLPWTITADPSSQGASGDVVWSPSRQEGYMRFVGLAANDPKLLQYQLWIFDKLRDERYPVDGGVFDVASVGPGGEIIIKIAPKLRVGEPVLFAVTVEPPGGVVVSKRERIVVTAAPAKAG